MNGDPIEQRAAQGAAQGVAEGAQGAQAAVDRARFEEMLAKARRGECCLLTCAKPSVLQTGVGADPPRPILCLDHLNDPDPTHLGEWVPTERAYYEKWTCCGSTWKKVVCRVLRDAFDPYALSIPVTAEQRADFDARVQREQEVREYWEHAVAQQNAGHEESYDR